MDLTAPGSIPPEELVTKNEDMDTNEEQQQHQEQQEGMTENQETHEDSNIMHAMTSDGQTVPITFNPETGEYTTSNGEPVVIQVANQDEEETQHEQDEQITPDEPQQPNKEEDISDLSSLAAAAAAHSIAVPDQTIAAPDQTSAAPDQTIEAPVQKVTEASLSELAAAGISTQHSSTMPLQNIRILNADGTISAPNQPSQLKIVNSSGQEIHGQQIKILNADGTVSSFGGTTSQPQQQQQQQQQIRIVKMEGGSGIANHLMSTTTSASSSKQPQIKIVNSDGTVSSLPGNVKMISQLQPRDQAGTVGGVGKYRVIRAAPPAGSAPINNKGSPVKTFTLAQAQQLGILPPTSANTNSKIKQVIVKGAPPQQQQQQQIIRINTSNLQAGSIQQIQVGNKLQYVRVVGATSNAPRSQNPQLAMKGTTPIFPKTSAVGGSGLPVVVSASGNSGGVQLSSLKGVKIAIPQQSRSASHQRVILPSSMQMKSIVSGNEKVGKISIRPAPSTSQPAAAAGQILNLMEHFMARKEEKDPQPLQQSTIVVEEPSNIKNEDMGDEEENNFEASGVRPRKPCNCTKSQCLKLYCDCFANGEFCFNCNCNNCYNNITHEEDRQKAIKQCLDRNPVAFKPKIGRLATDGERRHNKGCNCKRSGCLKNYCECYEAKIPCTNACGCVGCRNIEEDAFDEHGEDGIALSNNNANNSSSVSSFQESAQGVRPSLKSRLGSSLRPSSKNQFISLSSVASAGKHKFMPITAEVVEATCQCLLAQAEESERNKMTEPETESLILEEFGRCLSQIIDIAAKNNHSKSS